MQPMYGMLLLLVREIFGIPLDFALVGIFVGAMFGLILWGSRPSVIARYGKREADGDSAEPKQEDAP